MDYKQVDYKGDALNIFNVVKKYEAYSAWFGELIEDAKWHLRNHPMWSMNFKHREGNQGAHAIEKIRFRLCCRENMV